jgi:hypothetical protein
VQQLPYKETQAILLGEFLRDRKIIFFLVFSSWRNVHISPLRAFLCEKSYRVSFTSNDLFRFEPLVGLKMRHFFSQSGAFFIIEDSLMNNIGVSELNLFKDLFEKTPLNIAFLKINNYFLTIEQYIQIQKLFDTYALHNIFQNFIRQCSIFFYSFATIFLRSFFSYICIIKKDANFSSIKSKEKDTQSCTPK